MATNNLVLLFILLNTQKVLCACDLPWPGEWLENGREFNVTKTTMAHLGKCEKRIKDEFLLVHSAGTRGKCYRCLIAFPVHTNALQYKITQCIFDSKMKVEKCRDHFSGDTPLHTMFRKNSDTIPSPLNVPLSFTYHDSSGTCSSRTSTISRCAEWDRFAFDYQACPENPMREAAVHEVEFIATWESIGQQYFAARIGSNRGMEYRCFIHKKTGSSGRLGISADSGCQELTHIGAAASTLHYRQEANVEMQCDFPNYLWKHEYKRHKHNWDSLTTGTEHTAYRGLWRATHNGANHTIWQCLRDHHDGSIHTYQTHVRQGCTVGFQCVRFQRHRKHMLSVSFGPITLNEFEDCRDMYVIRRDTLVMQNEKEFCIDHGHHISPLCAAPVLSIGCDGEHVELATDCDTGEKETFDCVDRYSDEGQTFTAIRNRETNKLQCMTHVYSPISLIRIYDDVACNPVGVNGAKPAITLNITRTEKCSSSFLTGFLSSGTSFSTFSSIVILLVFIFHSIFI